MKAIHWQQQSLCQARRPLIGWRGWLAAGFATHGPAKGAETRMDIGPASTDADLIDLAAGGDPCAFRELVRRYEATVARTVHGMLGNTADADDAGQEVMVRLYRALATFRGEASLGTYVTRIALNVCFDQLKRRRRQAWQFWQADEDEQVGLADPHDTGAAIEAAQAVQRALVALKPDYRAVVLLRLLHGYSTEETADIIGIPVGTVLSRLARAKALLAAELEDYLDG